MLDRLSLRAPDNGDIGVDDTTWYNGFAIYELDAGNISTVSAATYSADISLTRQYGYFGLVFTSDIGTGTGVSVDNVALVPVPEPATMGLLGLGMLGLVLRRKKK
ncbi:MAG: PEP-CTERM sorting domain-containing protein [Anaerolineaceae bacterium]|nr:PEP-CTERM sorting domain-containing protein [Anaerolineaceae bacterium]